MRSARASQLEPACRRTVPSRVALVWPPISAPVHQASALPVPARSRTLPFHPARQLLAVPPPRPVLWSVPEVRSLHPIRKPERRCLPEEELPRPPHEPARSAAARAGRRESRRWVTPDRFLRLVRWALRSVPDPIRHPPRKPRTDCRNPVRPRPRRRCPRQPPGPGRCRKIAARPRRRSPSATTAPRATRLPSEALIWGYSV